MSTIYTTPGFTDERIHLYVATGLTRVPAALEADEFIETHERRWSEVGRMIRAGEIRDGKTLCALMWMQCFGLCAYCAWDANCGGWQRIVCRLRRRG